MGKISDTRCQPGSDIICLEGNGARPSHRGNGWSREPMFTLNSVEVHGVCYEPGAIHSAGKSSERFSDNDKGGRHLPKPDRKNGNRGGQRTAGTMLLQSPESTEQR